MRWRLLFALLAAVAVGVPLVEPEDPGPFEGPMQDLRRLAGRQQRTLSDVWEPVTPAKSSAKPLRTEPLETAMTPAKLRRTVGVMSARAAAHARLRNRLEMSRSTNDRARAKLDLYPSAKSAPRERRRPGPLRNEELRSFRAARLSPATIKTRKSHLKKIQGLLRREKQRLNIDEKDIDNGVGMLFEKKNIEVVAACLAAEELSSASNMIDSWKSEAPAPSASAAKAAKECRRRFLKYGDAEIEYDALPLLELQQRQSKWWPLAPGGPVRPYQAIAISSVMVWRPKTARSVNVEDVVLERSPNGEPQVTVVTGRKKTNQMRRRLRRTTVSCLCEAGAVCGACMLWDYVKAKGDVRAEAPLFGGVSGCAITPRALAATYHAIARELGFSNQLKITPHSARATGAQYWSGEGVSEQTIMDLGDWSCRQTLRKYIGSAGVAQKLHDEFRQRTRRGVIKMALKKV